MTGVIRKLEVRTPYVHLSGRQNSVQVRTQARALTFSRRVTSSRVWAVAMAACNHRRNTRTAAAVSVCPKPCRDELAIQQLP